MFNVSKRVLSVIGLLIGWMLLLIVHFSAEQNVFASFVAVPIIMLIMAFMTALHDA